MTCGTFAKKEDADKRITEIVALNKELKKQNAPIEAEIAKLNAQLAAKKREQANAKDDAAKAAAAKEVDALNDQIAQKKEQLRLCIVPVGPTKFAQRDQAQKYIADQQAEAQKAREKAYKDKPDKGQGNKEPAPLFGSN